jgi:hypothetical protein
MPRRTGESITVGFPKGTVLHLGIVKELVVDFGL